MKTALIAFALVIAASPSFAQALSGEIDAANARFEQAFNRGDAAAIAQMYTEKATVLPRESDIVTGREAIQAFWQGAIQSGIKDLSLKATRVEELASGTAQEIGRFSLEAPGSGGQGSKVEGKYVVIWRKSGGEWKLDTDIWNTNAPPPTAVATGGASAPKSSGVSQ
jgi:uncharacterized protein (TIGR02246 family)